jgi:uncharacterized protein
MGSPPEAGSTVAEGRQRVPAVDGWFTLDPDRPQLLGRRCSACGTVVFPPRRATCPNPSCGSEALVEVALGRTGRIWSFTTNHYAPPAPYISPDPFEPYTVAAVELADERLTVLGQVDPDIDPAALEVGQEVELVLGTLFTDEEREHVIWMWRPQVEAAGAAALPEEGAA